MESRIIIKTHKNEIPVYQLSNSLANQLIFLFSEKKKTRNQLNKETSISTNIDAQNIKLKKKTFSSTSSSFSSTLSSSSSSSSSLSSSSSSVSSEKRKNNKKKNIPTNNASIKKVQQLKKKKKENQNKPKDNLRNSLISIDDFEEKSKNQPQSNTNDPFFILKRSMKPISDSEETVKTKKKKGRLENSKDSIEMQIQDEIRSQESFGENIEYQKFLYKAIQKKKTDVKIRTKKQSFVNELRPCVVCLENDRSSDLKYTSCCDNPLHVECMVLMLSYEKEKCPVCRKENIELKDSCLKLERKYEHV